MDNPPSPKWVALYKRIKKEHPKMIKSTIIKKIKESAEYVDYKKGKSYSKWRKDMKKKRKPEKKSSIERKKKVMKKAKSLFRSGKVRSMATAMKKAWASYKK